jgi:hypothetical protein
LAYLNDAHDRAGARVDRDSRDAEDGASVVGPVQDVRRYAILNGFRDE